MKKIICCFIVLWICSFANAQNEHRVWYFGKGAGMEFTKKGPKALFDGYINTHEGCAALCDENGQLVIYSDGYEVRDGKHWSFSAGYGGHLSSTQSVLLVRRPGYELGMGGIKHEVYYIFAVGHEGGPCYVNKLLHLPGDTSLKIDPSTSYREMMGSGTEKLITAPHANGKDIWVIMHPWESDEFHAYLVSESGISLFPVRSKVGVHHGGEKGNATGYLKVSPCGNYVASCIRDMKLLELFSFDNKTGKMGELLAQDGNFFGYGLEFSPDGTKLYASVSNPVSTHEGGGVIQIDLDAKKLANGMFDHQVIGLSATNFVGALQLAPDGKIYVARFGSSHLAVINNPNEYGKDCNYVDDGFYLEGKECLLGLPNYTASYYCSTKKKRTKKRK